MFKLLNKKKNNKGFTLVELVIVIAILAILVGLLAPQYTKYVEKTRKAADAANEVPTVTGATIELKTAGVTAENETVKKALAEFCPDYTKMKKKSAKWNNSGDPTATINIDAEGKVTVTYGPTDFADYIGATATK